MYITRQEAYPRVCIVTFLHEEGRVSMSTKKKMPQKRTLVRNPGGRPARPMPELISDTPENAALAAMQGPPKKQKEWRYLAEGGN